MADMERVEDREQAVFERLSDGVEEPTSGPGTVRPSVNNSVR